MCIIQPLSLVHSLQLAMSPGLNSESIMDQLMDQFNEGVYDSDQLQFVSTNTLDLDLENGHRGNKYPEGKEEEEEGEWVPQHVYTEFGRTDDIITLGNGEEYYFFKIPHKVILHHCL